MADPTASDHWFEPVARHLGPAYWAPGTGRVMAFTRGTGQEVDFLWEALELVPGARVLDVGCGPGRHALELARRGAEVVGIDVSEEFVELASAAAAREGLGCAFARLDARRLDSVEEFDAAISLCQGGFGLPGDPDRSDDADDTAVFDRLVAALRPGGRLALSAFAAYFAVRSLDEHESFDAASGVHHEVTGVPSPEGVEARFDLWTSCWTPRELRLLASRAGLSDVAVHGVAPGRYGRRRPALTLPELLLLARRR